MVERNALDETIQHAASAARRAVVSISDDIGRQPRRQNVIPSHQLQTNTTARRFPRAQRDGGGIAGGHLAPPSTPTTTGPGFLTIVPPYRGENIVGPRRCEQSQVAPPALPPGVAPTLLGNHRPPHSGGSDHVAVTIAHPPCADRSWYAEITTDLGDHMAAPGPVPIHRSAVQRYFPGQYRAVRFCVHQGEAAAAVLGPPRRFVMPLPARPRRRRRRRRRPE